MEPVWKKEELHLYFVILTEMIVNKDISVEMLVTDSFSFRNLAGIQRVVKCENVIDIQKSLSLCVRNCSAMFL